jgi:TolB protein
VIDLRNEIRAAFEREQAAFPPPAALRAQVVAAVNTSDRLATPPRQRSGRNLDWLLVAAAALLTIAIVAGLLAVRLNLWHPTLVKPGPAPQLCVPGATSPSDRFAQVHGCITYVDGTQIVAVDPFHPANRIVLGPTNGQLPIAWSRDGTRLLLMSIADLYVMNADGSQTRLTHGDLSGWEGTLSPDGSKVVYNRWQEAVVPGGHLRTMGLYVVDAQGGAPQLIAKSDFCMTIPDNQNAGIQQGSCGSSSGGSELAYPTWSPDGSRIAYAEYRYDLATDEVWTMNSDGTDQRRLVSLGSCGGTQPTRCTNGLSWSPDGSQLAIHSVGGIYTVRADGSRLLRITKDGVQPSWSPDGLLIAFTRGGQLFTMAPDGRSVTLVKDVSVAPPYGWTWNPVAQPTNLLESVRGYITYTYGAVIWAVDPNHPSNPISLRPSHDRMPIAWSGDGSRLLLVEQTDLTDSTGAPTGVKRDLYVMNADGSQTRLTSDGLAISGGLSPDGAQVVFARQDLSLYLVDAKGGTLE